MNYLDFIKNNQKYFEDFITRSTYHSNAIEGSTLSINETFALLFESDYCNIENVSPREIYEAINHKEILNILLDKIEKREKLSKELLLEINQTINNNIIYVGGYRLGPIRIVGSEKKFPLPDELEEKMNNFINNYNDLITKDIKMEDIVKMHMNYENIHPFPDGNGRTGRLLINYLLLQKNICPIVIQVLIRKQYMEALENNDVEKLTKIFVNLQQQELDRINDFKA